MRKLEWVEVQISEVKMSDTVSVWTLWRGEWQEIAEGRVNGIYGGMGSAYAFHVDGHYHDSDFYDDDTSAVFKRTVVTS